MLSGTASWLTLAVYEFLGLEAGAEELSFSPILPDGLDRLDYTVRLGDTTLQVEITGEGGRFRAGTGTTFLLDGAPVSAAVPRPGDGKSHILSIRL